MKKFVLAVAAVLLVGAGCANPPANPQAQLPPQAAPTQVPPTTPVGKPVPIAVPNPGGISPANSEDRIVVFDGNAFIPANVAVHVGHTVTWQNKSTQDVWPQADSNQTGTSTREFDPRVAIHPGASWSYTFNRAGNWPYHNNLNTGAGGVVEVTPVGK